MTHRNPDRYKDKQTYIRTFLRIAEKGNFSFQTSRPPSTIVCRRRSEPGPGAVRLLVVVLPLPQLSLDHDFGRQKVVAGRRRRRHRASSERVAFALGNVVRRHRRWNRRTVIVFLGKWKPETKRKSMRIKNTTKRKLIEQKSQWHSRFFPIFFKSWGSIAVSTYQFT